VGQVFWYTVEGPYDPATAALQDWFIRYQLNSVPGVAKWRYPFVRQYRVDVDPSNFARTTSRSI
jgi:Cu(I)/Ag(I) efflux system membrane protein CusA/SilA